MTNEELTQALYQRIPISQQMGVEVMRASKDQALLKAPIAPNRNHLQTVFGGSLYCLGALSCYVLFLKLAGKENFDAPLVIQSGKIDYLLPATGDFEAEAKVIKKEDEENFLEQIRRSGKGRLSLKADLYANDIKVAEFTGTYVLLNENRKTISSS